VNWDAIGAIGEVVGAIAVIATLGYLALQVRQNSKMMKANIRELRTSSSQAVIFEFARNTESLLKQSRGEHVSDQDALRMQILIRAQMRDWESYEHQYRNGLFDKNEWEGMRENIKRQMHDQAHKEFWEACGIEFSVPFQLTIDECIKEGDT